MADPGFPVWGGVDPLGGVDLQCGHFSVKMYAKMKELGPVGGGGRAPKFFVCRSATGCVSVCKEFHIYHFILLAEVPNGIVPSWTCIV